MGIRSVTGGGNAGPGMVLGTGSGASGDMRVAVTKSDLTSAVVTATSPLADLHAKRAGITLVALRRDASAGAGVSPLTVFIDDQPYYMPLGADFSLVDLTPCYVKFGGVSGNVSQTTEIYGVALFGSALTDEQIAEVSESGKFPAGTLLTTETDERGGFPLGRSGVLPAIYHLNGTWLSPKDPKWWRNAEQFSDSVSLIANQKFIQDKTNNGNLVTCTLPAAPSVGDWVEVVGYGPGKWKIGQPAGHSIVEGAGATVGTNATTPGAGGSITAGQRYDSIRLECVLSDSVTPSYVWAVTRKSGTLVWA
jgi:hypothetical protein